MYGSQSDKYLKFDYELELMNTIIRAQKTESNNYEQWKLNSNSPNECDSGVDPLYNSSEFNPLKCRPIDRDWIQNTDSTVLKKEVTIVSDFLKFLDNANDSLDHKSLIYILNNLKNEYNEYIDLYLTSLIEFKDILYEISNFLRQYSNNKDDYIFSFINGKIIGTNLKIITKYIKEILGNDVKIIGICLIIIAFSFVLDVPFTIIFIIIINYEFREVDNFANNNNRPNTVKSVETNSERLTEPCHKENINVKSTNNIGKRTKIKKRKTKGGRVGNIPQNQIDNSPSLSKRENLRALEYIIEAKQFLIEGCKLDEEIFDPTYNRQKDWRKNDSGPKGYLKKYYPPFGLTGIGLKVALIYDDDDIGRSWLADNNNKGECYIFK